MSASAPTSRVVGPSIGTRERWREHTPALLVYAILVLLLVYTSAVSPAFRSLANFETLALQSIPLGLVAIGQLCVVLTGGLDMSVGMAGKFVAILAATLMVQYPDLVGLIGLAGLLAGALIGLCNGLIIVATRAVPFIVTLGMYGVLQGMSLAARGIIPTVPVPDAFLAVYTARVFEIPLAIIIAALIWIAAAILLRRSAAGRSLYATGGSERAARNSGIRTNASKLVAYSVCGLSGAAAGLFLLSRSGVGNLAIASNLEFQSIVAVVLGGASLFGGRGSITGTFGAVLLLTVILAVFQILKINPYFQDVFSGAIVLIAAGLYTTSERVRGR